LLKVYNTLKSNFLADLFASYLEILSFVKDSSRARMIIIAGFERIE